MLIAPDRKGWTAAIILMCDIGARKRLPSLPLRFAQSKVNELPEDEVFVDTMVGKMPNHWIKLRDEYRQKLEYCANNMVRNGIFDRAVNGGEPVNLTPSEDQAKKIAEAIKKAELR